MTDALVEDLLRSPGLPFTLMLLRLTGAALLCGVIGLEREMHKNTAGLRTNILVGIAAATFALITLALVDSLPPSEGFIQIDPLRLVEAVTGGVAFLAAGLIVFSDEKVYGLTTGASMWLAAAIGLACGLGFWSLALLASVIGLLVLSALRQLQAMLGLKKARDDESSK